MWQPYTTKHFFSFPKSPKSTMANWTTQTTLPAPRIDTLGTSLYTNDHVAIIGANVLIGILGLLGNSTVILVYLRNPKMTRSLTSLFIFHQSFIDLVTSFIFLAIRLDTLRPLLGSGVADIACRLWYSEYLLWVTVMTSTLNLLLVSMERYVCIAHSAFHRNHFTRGKAKVSMMIAWVFSLVYQAYWAVVSTAVDGKCEPRWPNEGMQTFFGIATFIVEYLVPLILMTFAYTSIISRLNQRCRVSALYEARAYVPRDISNTTTDSTTDGSLSHNQTPRSTTSTHARIEMFSKAKINVAKTLCIVFATYVICWTPTELEYLVYNLGGSLDFNGPLHRVTVILVLCNMCANPIIYALKYREFQKSLKQMLANCCEKLRHRRSTLTGSETEQMHLKDVHPHSPIASNHAAVNLAMHV